MSGPGDLAVTTPELARRLEDIHRRHNLALHSVREVSEDNRRRLDALIGQNNNNGIVGHLRVSHKDQEKRLRDMEKIVVKHQILTAIVAAVSATALSVVAKLIFG